MGRPGLYLGLLAASPALALGLHAVASRLATRLAPRMAPQLVGGLAVLAGYPVVAALAWVVHLRRLPPDAATAPAVYGLLVYTGLAFCYYQIYNLSETARRIRILYELQSRGGLDRRELEQRYTPARLLSVRLTRLVALGQLEAAQGRYRIRGRALWLAASLVDAWAVVLGYPSRKQTGILG